MRLLSASAAVLLLAAACSSSSGEPTSTTSAPASVAPSSPRVGLVPDPAAIRSAAAVADLTALDADRFQVAGMWGDFESIPLEFMTDTVSDPQWDHTATTRLLARWDELDVVTKGRLLQSVDGLGEFIDGSRDQCALAGTLDLFICDGASLARSADGPAAADAVRDWVREAADRSWGILAGLFGAAPSPARIYLADLHAEGGYTSGPIGGGGLCHVFVDVLDTAGDDSSVPPEAEVKATVAHNLFHCFQAAVLSDSDPTLWEATATWAMHHIYPDADTELRQLASWVANPGEAFESRLGDAAFPLFVAERAGMPAAAVVRALRSNSVAVLSDDFIDLWDEASVLGWNAAPVERLLGDGYAICRNDDCRAAASIQADPAVSSTSAVRAEVTDSIGFRLAPYSREVVALGFEEPDVVGVHLDLSMVPDDVRVSAIGETTNGWLGPGQLEGEEWSFCRRAIGACSDAAPEWVGPLERVVLFVTNVDNGSESFEIGWHSHNPALDGTWSRVDGPLSTSPGETSAYSILGTTLVFDESGLRMTEETGSYTVVSADPSLECDLAGSYSLAIDPSYGSADGGDVDGTVTFDVATVEGEGLSGSCAAVTGDGSRRAVRNEHVAVVAGPEGAFGFEIRGYITLWIYAHERIYVYERVG